jgi:proteasome lid subunit RPN8/RPN11
MKKLTKLDLQALRNEFHGIEESESRFYVGARGLQIGSNGSQNGLIDELDKSTDYILLSTGERMDFAYGTLDAVMFNPTEIAHQSTDTQRCFEFLADNTSIEWGMKIKTNGEVRIYTSSFTDKVYHDMSDPGNISQIVHSHPGPNASPRSDTDMESAFTFEDYPIKWTLYSGGQYKDYFEPNADADPDSGSNSDSNNLAATVSCHCTHHWAPYYIDDGCCS